MGRPEIPPEGNCRNKCITWLKNCNDHPEVKALEVFGAVIQDYMDHESPSTSVTEGRKSVNNAFSKNQLSYRINGIITTAGSTSISKTLEDFLRSGDFSSIEDEFDRAVKNIQGDPHSSITASCAIIEAALKFYIERSNDLDMPGRLNAMNLWHVVQRHLTLNDDETLATDQHKALKGISSMIDGVGSFRSHIGSAHGRGSNPSKIVVAEARLVVNAAHTLVIFIMELLRSKK